MKTSALNALASAAAFFVMCASLMAAGQKPSVIQQACLKCHGGGSVNGDIDFTQRLSVEQRLEAVAMATRGEMPKSGPKLTPAQLAQLKIELGLSNTGTSGAPKQAPSASPVANRPAPSSCPSTGTVPNAPLNPATTAARNVAFNPTAGRSTGAPAQGRLSTVGAGATSDDVPTARVRVVPAGSQTKKPVSTARVVVVSTADEAKATVAPPKPIKKRPPVAVVTPTNTDDLAKKLDALNATKEDTSKISEPLKGLVGDWMAVSRHGDGELSTVELQLDDHGWAKLTIPGADGKPSTTTRKVELKDSQLTLTNESGVVSLGKLVSSDDRQMVLERETGLVTFVRP